ncbi:uncharacterized protein J3D65DRAFT_449500 [Phyllosticta citribraziliensis]|uniref:Peroxin 22-like protein n=1 Tax=Phyllosticta citribraziliensis TaxID=989973 RepID=A0ABR1LKV7_9PEZI
MSFSYDRYDRRQQSSRRSTLGYWVPLIVTVTIATAGVAAWIWSERSEGDDDDDDDHADWDDPRPQVHDDDSESASLRAAEDEGFVARMSGAIRRTPSPQQVFDNASKKLAAGVSAAGTAFGAALASIREEERDDYADHSRWSEEAARQVEAQSSESAAAVRTHTEAFAESARLPSGPDNRKKVAIVLSADAAAHEEEQGAYHEQASILSHLPQIDHSTTNLLILIYAPHLKPGSSSSNKDLSPGSTGNPMAASLGSSYSAISATSADQPLTTVDPQPHDTGDSDSNNALYSTIHAAARRLVPRSTNILPFSSSTGHVHMLKHLAPRLVYMTDDLTGPRGENVVALKPPGNKHWVGQIMVVVGSQGAGTAGLVDTEDDEGDQPASGKEARKWWEESHMVGLGKGVEIVDADRLVDDFERRACGKE